MAVSQVCETKGGVTNMPLMQDLAAGTSNAWLIATFGGKTSFLRQQSATCQTWQPGVTTVNYNAVLRPERMLCGSVVLTTIPPLCPCWVPQNEHVIGVLQQTS